MKLILDENELEELKIEDLLKSNDLGIVIQSQVGKRNEGVSELQKEIVAIDALENGVIVAGKVNGVPFSSASKYKEGKDLGDDTKTRVLDLKYNIQDKATTKLMETLDLFNPSNLEKPRDIIAAARDLSSIVERISGKDSGNQQVHLHLYNPTQRKVNEYEIIDV